MLKLKSILFKHLSSVKSKFADGKHSESNDYHKEISDPSAETTDRATCKKATADYIRADTKTQQIKRVTLEPCAWNFDRVDFNHPDVLNKLNLTNLRLSGDMSQL